MSGQAEAVDYSEPEGGPWTPVPVGVRIATEDMRQFEPGKYQTNVCPYPGGAIVYHALRFDNGKIWDCVNGFREPESA